MYYKPVEKGYYLILHMRNIEVLMGSIKCCLFYIQELKQNLCGSICKDLLLYPEEDFFSININVATPLVWSLSHSQAEVPVSLPVSQPRPSTIQTKSGQFSLRASFHWPQTAAARRGAACWRPCLSLSV